MNSQKLINKKIQDENLAFYLFLTNLTSSTEFNQINRTFYNI